MSEQNAPFFIDLEIIRLSKDGVWTSDGVEITHEPTRRLFAKSLKKTPDGYFLFIGRESKKIEVEDTAFFVTRIDETSHGEFELTINDETKEMLDPKTLQYRPARLTCRLLRGEEAKFLSAPYMDLLKNLEENEAHYFLRFASGAINLLKKF